jgi:hypothetical protein
MPFILNGLNCSQFDLFDNKQIKDFVEAVDPKLIEATLSRISRFAGQRSDYSVLQHSIFCYFIAMKMFSAMDVVLQTKGQIIYEDFIDECLFHDVEESITGDIITPVKRHLSENALIAIDNLRLSFYNHLGIKANSLVHKVDNIAFHFEDLIIPLPGFDLKDEDKAEKIEIIYQAFCTTFHQVRLSFQPYFESGILVNRNLIRRPIFKSSILDLKANPPSEAEVMSFLQDCYSLSYSFVNSYKEHDQHTPFFSRWERRVLTLS